MRTRRGRRCPSKGLRACAAILVANGAAGENTSQADGFAKLLGIDGVGLENAAKSKLVGFLAERPQLAAEACRSRLVVRDRRVDLCDHPRHGRDNWLEWQAQTSGSFVMSKATTCGNAIEPYAEPC